MKVRHRRSSVCEVFGTLFYTFSIFSSPPVNFGVAPGLVSHRLFIPTCGSWLTAQHTTGSRTQASSGQCVAMDTASSKPVNEYFFFFIHYFWRARVLKSVFWDKEPLGRLQLWLSPSVVCPASLLLPLWPSTHHRIGGALIYETLESAGTSKEKCFEWHRCSKEELGGL